MAKNANLLLFAAGAAGLLWLLSTRSSSAANAAAGAAASLAPGAAPAGVPGGELPLVAYAFPGSSALPAAAASTAANYFASLTPVNAIDSGYINLPDGTQIDASLLSGGNTRTDVAGNYYIEWAGQVWQLGAMDQNGNWPATPVANSSGALGIIRSY